MGFRRILCEDTELIQLAFVHLYKVGNEPMGCIKRALFRTFLEHCLLFLVCKAMKVGPCHHGMARPQIADGGTASDMEGSCEYTE
jgi:hypothetical protein